MKWLIAPLTALLALLLTEQLPTAHAQSAKASQNFVPGELIVGYKSEQDRDSALNDIRSGEGKLRGPGGSGVQAEELGETGLKLSFDFSGITRGPSENSPSDLALLQGIAKSLRESDNRVKYAHPNWILNIEPRLTDKGNKSGTELQGLSETLPGQQSPNNGAPNDPLLKLQWNYLPPPTGMNAFGAWDRPVRSSVALEKPIIVAVLDTGITYDHEDLSSADKILRGYSFVSRNYCTGEPLRRVDDATDTGNFCPSDNSSSEWHGTHVAGIVGAIGNNARGIAGITWQANVKILPVRVLGPHGGSTEDIAMGIRWAAGLPVKGAPTNTNPANVINMSLFGRLTCDQENLGALISAILDARRAGAVVVAIAGNGVNLDSQGNTCSSGDACRHVQEDFHRYNPGGCPIRANIRLGLLDNIVFAEVRSGGA